MLVSASLARAAISADGKTACVIEVNSETDFVAKNETFTSFVEAVNAAALASDLQGGKDGEDIEALLAVPFEGATVKDALVEKTATIGEKLSIRRFEKVAGDVAVSYIHGGGRIGVIVAANGASDDAAREALSSSLHAELFIALSISLFRMGWLWLTRTLSYLTRSSRVWQTVVYPSS